MGGPALPRLLRRKRKEKRRLNPGSRAQNALWTEGRKGQTWREQVQSIFGKGMLKYTLNLCHGHYDFLVRMPENLIVHIMSFLNVEDIEQLSKTCKRFQQLCKTDEFWERIKRLQDKYTLDVQTAKFPAYKKQRNFHQRRGFLTQMQRRQTTFF
ncbi:F-box only protein 36-like isoform X2 [Python bivittatus]|uniref:F-box only protein 36-like isoform X2 n=1 Tax=Python bivittatus TaxID=176946 RepID=A0A9F5ITW8_PYTBI|nr:F-box only protein 36-like isoform X2 [Python bivittatus]